MFLVIGYSWLEWLHRQLQLNAQRLKRWQPHI
jgi:hypothetical protein